MKISLIRQFLILLMALALLSLTACSRGSKKPEYYSETETPSLKIPEGMSAPGSSSALVIQAPYMPPPSMVMIDMPPRISSTTSGIAANSRLKWSAEGLYLLVDDTPESAHRRLGLIIERSGMERIELDDEGVYRFDYYQTFDEKGLFRRMAFWSRDKSEDYSGAYQTYVKPEGKMSRVYIKYADGTDCEPDAAEHLLIVVGARMG